MAAGQVELLGGYHAAGGSTGSSDNAGVKLKRSHTGVLQQQTEIPRPRIIQTYTPYLM